MTFLRQLLTLFSRRQRWQLALLLVAMIVQAAAELIGVASIAPFMSVVADPSTIQRNEWLGWAYETAGSPDVHTFLMGLGVTVIVVLAFTNGISALVIWASHRFAAAAQHKLSTRLVRGYLGQPYGFFVQRNTSKLHKNVLSEVQSVIKGVVSPTLNLTARSFVALAIVGLLIALDPSLAGIIVVLLGGSYGIIALIVRSKQRQLGKDRVEANAIRYKVTGEAFGGIKEAKVFQREHAFLEQFEPPSLRYCRARAANATIAAMPRYLLEAIAFGGIVLIVLYYLGMERGVAEVLPILSLYAFAGYRLMPSLQQIFSSMANIRFNRAALDDILTDAAFLGRGAPRPEGSSPLPFREAIRLEGVTFRYPGASEDALKEVDLQIERHETVGLVGPSGSGKTTLVDLLLGLYEARSGRITIDERILESSTISAWRRQIGYIPQHIFLTDDSIERNIAFGVPDDEIDRSRVERAARIANLEAFVETLPIGYRTVVGERGVRVSGGQRQRIGIARALYHDPEVLIMDEATSSLDGVTEDAVMEAIRELSGEKTIVLIAHRLTTVRDCTCIYLLEGGRVVDKGTFRELVAANESFRAMAKVRGA